MSENDLYDFTTMFNESQIKLNRQFTSINTFRDYSKTVVGYSSVIISLFATLKITSVPNNGQIQYFSILGLIGVLYIWLVITGIQAFFPETITGSISPSYEEYKKAFLGKEKKDILKQQISNYLNAIEINEPLILKKRNLCFRLSILFSGIVVLILLESVLGLM